jgi:hypothetical protein
VPFLKVDKGLAEEANGVQVMKPIPGLDDLLERAVKAGVFGTKMRSVISRADNEGIEAVVGQQFDIGRQIMTHGLVPIIEPEVDIHSPTKAEAEELLRASIERHLDQLTSDQLVMLKLSIPTVDDFYRPLIEHPRVVRVVALSGGYSRDDANARLARNHGMIASFSRALTEGLTAQMSDDEFDKLLDAWFANFSRALLPGHGFFVWGGYANLGNYPPFLKKHGLYFSQGIVWDKEHPVLTRKDFMGAFEICFYGWREGAAHRFFGPNYRRLKDPEFKSQLQAARQEMVERTANMLTAASTESVKTLLRLQSDPAPHAVQLGAAKAIVELGTKLRENAELFARVAALETQELSMREVVNEGS